MVRRRVSLRGSVLQRLREMLAGDRAGTGGVRYRAPHLQHAVVAARASAANARALVNRYDRSTLNGSRCRPSKDVAT